MRLAIIGRTSMLYDTAIALRDAGHEIACVVTAPATPEYSRTEDDFRELAQASGAAFFCAARGSSPDFQALCNGVDVGVSVNWVSTLTARHLAPFRIGVLNAHHGDLPAYRGNACSNWAILAGEPAITASVHLMEGGVLDCGRVICQERYPLGSATTIGEIYEWSSASTPRLLCEAVERLAKDPAYTLKVARLDAEDSFRCYPRMAQDMFIDWTRPARDVDALVRASSRPFDGAYTFHWAGSRVRKLRVLGSRVLVDDTKDLAEAGQVLENNRDSGEALVRCGNGVMALIRCRYDDETEEFAPGRRWTSIRMRLGVRAEDWLWQLTQGR